MAVIGVQSDLGEERFTWLMLPGLSLSLSLFLVPLLLLLLPLGLHSSFFFVLCVFYIRYLEAGFAGRATAPWPET